MKLSWRGTFYIARPVSLTFKVIKPLRTPNVRTQYRRHPDGAGIVLANALNVLMDSAHGVDPPADRDGIERPLEQGPLRESEREEDYEGPTYAEWTPEMRDLMKPVRKGSHPGVDPHSEEADWMDPLTSLRPRWTAS